MVQDHSREPTSNQDIELGDVIPTMGDTASRDLVAETHAPRYPMTSFLFSPSHEQLLLAGTPRCVAVLEGAGTEWWDKRSPFDLIFILAWLMLLVTTRRFFYCVKDRSGCSAPRTRHPLQGDVDREAQMGKGVGVDVGGNGARVTRGRVAHQSYHTDIPTSSRPSALADPTANGSRLARLGESLVLARVSTSPRLVAPVKGREGGKNV